MSKIIFRKLFSSSLIAVPDNDWNKKNIATQIILLGIPLVFGEFGSIIQQICDTIMVGHYGTIDLAAAAFINSIFYYVIFITLGMSFASTSLIGSAFKIGDDKGVFRIFCESIILNLLVGITLVVFLSIIYCNIEKIFFKTDITFIHQPDAILEPSKGYFKMLIISVVPLTLFYACKQYLDGIGFTTISMWILFVSNALNIILNYCLIYGAWIFPEFGVKGAGLATLIARIFQLIVVVFFVVKTSIVWNSLKKRIKIWQTFNEMFDGVLEQFKFGLPVSFQLFLEIGIFNVCGIFIGSFGVEQLAAHQAMYSISTICFQVLYGVGAAAAILISYFYATKAWDKIRMTAKAAFWIGFVLDAISIVLICIFFEKLASCFTDDENVIKYMWMILPCLAIYQFGDCMQIIFANSLRGIKNTKPLAIITPIAYLLVCVPICYIAIFVFNMGVKWAWSGIPIGLLLAGLLFRWHFYANVKRHELSDNTEKQ